MDSAKSTRGTVRALVRGLDILRHVNRVGVCTPAEIARDVGIPRPTVYRLLETLEEQGYVALSPTSNRVRVTRLAAALGDGFAVNSKICQVAGPVLTAAAGQVVWPVDLTVLENAAMVVQETTHARSPLSIDRGMTGYRLPMLRSSAGRCYLGLCPEAEREAILDQIRRLDDPYDAPFLVEPILRRMLDETVKRQLGTRLGTEFQPKTSSFAVPIWSDNRIVACLSVIWTRGALTLSSALQSLEAQMRAMSADISAALEL